MLFVAVTVSTEVLPGLMTPGVAVMVTVGKAGLLPPWLRLRVELEQPAMPRQTQRAVKLRSDNEVGKKQESVTRAIAESASLTGNAFVERRCKARANGARIAERYEQSRFAEALIASSKSGPRKLFRGKTELRLI